MIQSIFEIPKMDCPSEEHLIRMKLQDLTGIASLDFNIPGRRLTVFHTGPCEPILQHLESLQLGAALVISVEKEASLKAGNPFLQRKILWQVLFINLFFFVLEITTGFLSDSMGLVADSLDMLADGIVYGLALFAVTGPALRKKQIARVSGYFQLALALAGFTEVIRRFVTPETVPDFWIMILVSLFALMGNAASLILLQKSKNDEEHMQASRIFTSNDIIANLGVIVAAIFVYLTHSRYPDLIIGTAVFFLVMQGAVKILRISK